MCIRDILYFLSCHPANVTESCQLQRFTFECMTLSDVRRTGAWRLERSHDSAPKFFLDVRVTVCTIVKLYRVAEVAGFKSSIAQIFQVHEAFTKSKNVTI